MRQTKITTYGKVNVLLKTPWEVAWVFVDSVIFVQSEWSANIEKTG
jgi:hypothetical protein